MSQMCSGRWCQVWQSGGYHSAKYIKMVGPVGLELTITRLCGCEETSVSLCQEEHSRGLFWTMIFDWRQSESIQNRYTL